MAVEKSSLILVAVINNLRDFEIARVLGWYRIPLKSAPKVVAVDHLAFYQTSAFGADKWRITYTAQVRGHELTTRGELLKDENDHPSASHEYFKLQLGPLERLPDSILANKWRRITFFYTTGEYLLRARSVDDLVIRSNERQGLWRSLRERADQNTHQVERSDGSMALDLSPEILSTLLGIRDADVSLSDKKPPRSTRE